MDPHSSLLLHNHTWLLGVGGDGGVIFSTGTSQKINKHKLKPYFNFPLPLPWFFSSAMSGLIAELLNMPQPQLQSQSQPQPQPQLQSPPQPQLQLQSQPQLQPKAHAQPLPQPVQPETPIQSSPSKLSFCIFDLIFFLSVWFLRKCLKNALNNNNYGSHFYAVLV